MNTAPIAPRSPLRLILASMAAYNLAAMQLWLQPVIVNEFIAQRGLSSSLAGLIATGEMIVLALTMMGWAALKRQAHYRTLGVGGMLLSVFGAVAAMTVTSIPLLLLARLIAAIGFGLLMLVPSMAIAALPNAQAVYGRMYSQSLICSAIVLALLPMIHVLAHHSQAFQTYLLYTALLTPLLLLMPGEAVSASADGGQQAVQSQTARQQVLRLALGLAILALAFFAVWAFFIRFAQQAGLSMQQASVATALSLLGAIVGSLSSAPLTQRLGAKAVMGLATLFVALGLLTVVMVPTDWAFRTASCVTLVAFYLLFPVVMGAAAQADPSGRGTTVVNAAAMIVGALGPYLGGLLLDTVGTRALAALTALCALTAFALFRGTRHAAAGRAAALATEAQA